MKSIGLSCCRADFSNRQLWFRFKISKSPYIEFWNMLGRYVSDRLPVPGDELAALNEAGSPWHRPDWSLFIPCIISQYFARCCVKRAVIALIYRATFSDVTDALEDFPTSWSAILLGVNDRRLSISGTLSVSSVSVSLVFLSVWEADLLFIFLSVWRSQIIVFWVNSGVRYL